MRLFQRDIDGFLLCGEHYRASSDLLAVALRAQPDRATGSLPPENQARTVIRELPAATFTPEAAP